MPIQALVAVLYGAAALAAVGTAWYVRSQRARSPLTSPMLMILGGITGWSVTAAATSLSSNLAWKTAWDAAVYLGVGTTVVGFLFYSAVFSGYSWAGSRRLRLALAIEPLTAATACATNGLHHLFYSSVRELPDGAYSIKVGPLLWAHAAYSFALCALAVGMVVRSSFHTVAGHRRLTWMLLGGALVPLLANLGSLLAASQIDVTPIGFLVAAGVFLVTEKRGSKLRLVPLAAEQVLAALSDAVVVVDRAQRVLDVNPAAQRLLEEVVSSPPERPVGRLWHEVAGPGLGPVLAGTFGEATACTPDDQAAAPEGHGSAIVHIGGQSFDARVLPLHGRNRQTRGYVVVIRDVTEVEKLRTVLAEQALKDGLTGAYNRRYLMQALAPAVEHATAAGEPLSAVMIDLDHFKTVNDTHGHRVGDEILCQVASCIMERMSPGQVLARFGGEEFLALLPGVDMATALVQAERWRRSCLEVRVQAADAWVGASISAGVAQLPAGGSPESLVSLADDALYQAKAQGRNQVAKAALRAPALGARAR